MFSVIQLLSPTVQPTPDILNSQLAQYNTISIDNIFIIFNFKPLNIPVALQSHAKIVSTKSIDIDSFELVVSNQQFCSRRGGVSGKYATDSIQRDNMTILLIIPTADVLVGFATIKFGPSYIEIDTICGDATFIRVSNILIGIVEQLCILLGFTQIRLDSVPAQVELYKHFGFTVNLPAISNNLIPMTNNNKFTNIYPISDFDKPVTSITRRSANSGRSPRTVTVATVAPQSAPEEATSLSDIGLMELSNKTQEKRKEIVSISGITLTLLPDSKIQKM